MHEALAANCPPVYERMVGSAPSVPHVPEPQLLTKVPLTAAMPDGSSSRNVTPVSASAVFGLTRVNVSVEVSPTRTEAGEKALAMVGGSGSEPGGIVVQTVPDPVKFIWWMRKSMLGLAAS